MALASNIGKSLIAAAPAVAPGATAQLLRRLIDYSINGLGRLPGARVSAAGALERAQGDFEAAIVSLTRGHGGKIKGLDAVDHGLDQNGKAAHKRAPRQSAFGEGIPGPPLDNN